MSIGPVAVLRWVADKVVRRGNFRSWSYGWQEGEELKALGPLMMIGSWTKMKLLPVDVLVERWDEVDCPGEGMVLSLATRTG
jgi:hypothetical protein